MKRDCGDFVSWTVRLVAAAVDLGCVGLLAGWLAVALPWLGGAGFFGVGAAYYLGCEWRFGRTLGKVLCGVALRVKRAGGGPPGRGRLVMRSVLRLLGPIGMVSWRRRTLLDRLTGVVAIAAESLKPESMRSGERLGVR